MSYDPQAGPLDHAVTRVVVGPVPWAVALQSHLAQLPAGFYVQYPPQRHVAVKKPDGTWARVVSVAGVRMKDADGQWVIVGEF